MRIVIIGYGNSLRTDDGFGPAVAARLQAALGNEPIVAQRPRSAPGGEPAVTVLSAQQLLPEHVDLLRDARLVLLVDASEEAPGSIRLRLMQGPGSSAPNPAAHALSPDALVALARALHGRVPKTLLLSVGGFSFDAGESLTVEMTILADQTAQAIATRIHRLLTRHV